MRVELAYTMLGIFERLAEQCAERELLALCRSEDLEDPPSYVEADAATTSAFRIAAYFRKQGATPQWTDPVRVSSLLCRLQQELSSSGLFDFSASGVGHINVTAAEAYWRQLFSVVIPNGGKPLFSTASYCGQPGELSLLPFSAPEWQQSERVLGPESDALQFLHTRTNQTPADRLQALAMAADRELDAGPYLRGLSGRQNAVWYFKRFSSDWRRYQEAAIPTAPVTEPENAQQYVAQWIACLSEDSTRPWQRSRYLQEVARFFVSLRTALYLGAPQRRPVNLLSIAMAAVRAFYSYYNHPGNRPSHTGDRTLLVSSATGALGSHVEMVLEMLGLPVEEL